MSRVAASAVVVAATWAVLALGTAPAHAHGGGAVFPTLEATEVSPGEVEVRVAVVHESDGHPAEGALVEVAATGPDGATVAPQEAARQQEPGVYLATLALPAPGAWTVTVVSSFPPGTAEVPVAVALGEAAATPTPTTAAGPEAPTTTGVTGAAGPDDEGPPPPTAGAAEEDDTLNWVVAGIFGLLGGGLGLWVSNRRGQRKRAASGTDPGSG